MRLIAMHKLEDGTPDGIAPGATFEVKDKKDADRLIAIGAAKAVEEKQDPVDAAEKPAKKKGKDKNPFELPEA